MDVGDSRKTIDLTPGIATPAVRLHEGVLFDGMTEDGSKVFFTTKDALHTATNQDTDSSADIYEAEVSEAGALTLTRVSTGTDGTGNSDACDPVSNSNGSHWNTVGSAEDCGVVAIGGGGGVAADDRLDLLPLPRAARRPHKRHPKPAQPLPRRPGSGPALHCHP